ncbi:MAG: response regulator transcription factor [Myxococcales bacterium]|nr:response regulator transcription factor [Myxococcales bacterium]
MTLTDRIKVRVIHDDPIAQEGLSAAFSRYADLEIEGTARGQDDLKPAVWPPGRRSADVVVADYANGVAIAAKISQETHAPGAPKVMILAAVDREWEIRSALERGVRGYVLMGCPLDDLAHGVRAVHRGERHLSPRIAARLAESMSVEPLTMREEEVLRLVVSGLCNKAIGKILGIAVGTVKSHLKSTFDKLGVQSRTQAVAAVERRGLLRDQPTRALVRGGFGVPPAVRMSAHGGSSHRVELSA